MTTPAEPLTPTSPVDATFRRLARLCEERAAQAPQDPQPATWTEHDEGARLACSGLPVEVLTPPDVPAGMWCAVRRKPDGSQLDEMLGPFASADEARAAAEQEWIPAPPDFRPIYRFCAIHCQQLAQMCQRLSPDVLAHYTAVHVVSALPHLLQETPGDPVARKAMRTAYQVLIGLLVKEKVYPEPDLSTLVVACSLWVMLQQVAMAIAAGPMEGPRLVRPGVDPQQEQMAHLQRLIGLREGLLMDLGEMLITTAGAVLRGPLHRPVCFPNERDAAQ